MRERNNYLIISRNSKREKCNMQKNIALPFGLAGLNGYGFIIQPNAVCVCVWKTQHEMIRGRERGEDRRKEQDRETDWPYVSAKVKSNVRFGSSGHFKFVSLAA